MARLLASCRVLERLTAWFGKVAGWLVLILVFAVCLSVLTAYFRINELVQWEMPLPLFGTSLTANGLLDLHWHLFAMLVMLGGAYALHTDAHISVDFLASRFSPRVRAVVQIAGDMLFLLPFVAIMAWYSWHFMLSSYRIGEGSAYGGLVDRWIIKAFLPLGFGLLAVQGTARVVRTAIELVLPPSQATPDASDGARRDLM